MFPKSSGFFITTEVRVEILTVVFQGDGRNISLGKKIELSKMDDNSSVFFQ